MALQSNALALISDLEDDCPGITQRAAERAINAASDLIEQVCNRKFRRTVGVVERVAGYGRQKLSVQRMPLESIASITYGASAQAVDPSGYRIDDDGSQGLIHNDAGWQNTASIVDANAPFYLPGTELRDYVVTYTGGFWLPDQTPDLVGFPLSQVLPSSVVEACLAVAAAIYRGKGEDHAILSESIGNASVTYMPNRQFLSPVVMQLLSDFVVAA